MASDSARTDSVSLLDIVTILLRRRWIVISMTLGVAVVSLAVLLPGRFLRSDSVLNLVPDWYMPTVKVLLQESTSSSSISDMLRSSGLSNLVNLSGFGASSKRSSAELAKDLLQTTVLLDAVSDDLGIVEKYHITEQPRTSSRNVITEHLDVAYKDTSGIMTIGYKDTDRDFAMKAVTRIVAELAKEFRRLTLDQVALKRSYLEQSVATQSVAADHASRSLIAFQSTHGVLDVNTQMTEIARSTTQLQSQLTTKQLELKVQEPFLPSSDARIVKLKSEIEQIKALIDAVRDGSAEYDTGGVSQKDLPELQLQYSTLKRDAELKQQILVALKQQLELVRLEELSTASSFQIIENAEIPEKKAGPGRAKTAFIATFLAGVISLVVAFVVDYFQVVSRDPANESRITALREAMRPIRRRRKPHDTGA